MAIKRVHLVGKQEGLPLTPNVVFRTHIILLLSSSHGRVQFHPSLVLPVGLINFSHYFPPAGLHPLYFPFRFRRKESDWPNSMLCIGQMDHVEQSLPCHSTRNLWQAPIPSPVGVFFLFKE